jgi:hypothetical protein
MMKKTYPLFCAILALLMASLACTIGQSQPPPQAPQQQNDTTTSVSLTLTAIAIQNPAAAPNAQPQPTLPAPVLQPTQAMPQPPAAQPTPIPPTAVQIPCDRASFVKDVTIHDGAKVKAGEIFNKTWTLKNNGSCAWTSGYSLVFERGDQMGAAAAANFTAAAINPGQNVDVTVTLTTPSKPGTYQGYFMLKNASGKKFGIGNNADQAFWVKIVVEGAAGPDVHKSGMAEIPQTYTVDLDSGAIGAASGADIQYQVDVNWRHVLNFRIPAKQMSREPRFEDCANAQMDSPTIPIDELKVGDYFCYLTDEGRLGYLSYQGSPAPGLVHISFITWKK